MSPRDRGEAGIRIPLPGVMARAGAGVGEGDAIALAHALAPVVAQRDLAKVVDRGDVLISEHRRGMVPSAPVARLHLSAAAAAPALLESFARRLPSLSI